MKILTTISMLSVCKNPACGFLAVIMMAFAFGGTAQAGDWCEDWVFCDGQGYLIEELSLNPVTPAQAETWDWSGVFCWGGVGICPGNDVLTPGDTGNTITGGKVEE